MRHLIAVSNPEAARQISTMVTRLGDGHTVQTVHSLNEAFHLAEHDPPDFLFLGPRFALDPLFGGLHALVKQIKTTCAIMLPTGPTRPEAEWLATQYGLPTVDVHLGQHVFRTSLEALSGGHRNGRPDTAAGRIDPDRAILIGASTGGVEALQKVLASFPADCPPTYIVQHTSRGFGEGLVRLLDGSCRATVKPAVDGKPALQGHIYLAADSSQHLLFESGSPHRCRLVEGEKRSGHRPSIDALFESGVAKANCISAGILTGMGRDGAEGLLALRRGGAITYGQDEPSSVVYGMPRAAFELGAVQAQYAPYELGCALIESCRDRKEKK